MVYPTARAVGLGVRRAMKTLLSICCVLALFGCSFGGAQAQTTYAQPWIASSSSLHRDAGVYETSTVTSSISAAFGLPADADVAGSLSTQRDGNLPERGLTPRIDNFEGRNIRSRDRGTASCLHDNSMAADAGATYLDRRSNQDLFDELELVLAFAEQPSGMMISEDDLGQLSWICRVGAVAPRDPVTRTAKKIPPTQGGLSFADPIVQQHFATEQSANGS
jgi:hypothetical protein